MVLANFLSITSDFFKLSTISSIKSETLSITPPDFIAFCAWEILSNFPVKIPKTLFP